MTYQSTGRGGAREIHIAAQAPGHALPDLATFEYREVYRSAAASWEPVVYAYEYRAADGGRRAYHLHDGRYHAHCVDPADPGRDHHFRATEIDLFEAHDEFQRLYVTRVRVTCDDLRPALEGFG